VDLFPFEYVGGEKGDRMKFVYNDGGREAAGFKGHAGDCVARSIAIASGRSYAEVYKALADGSGSERQTRGRSARNGIRVKRKWFKDYMGSIGFEWVPTMGIGTGCKVHLHDGELPSGRLVVAVSKHYTAVIDGEIHDTHNPQRGGTLIWVPVWNDPAGKWIEQPRRCVYGYWRFTGKAA
jgi:hypothetical protein